MDNLENTNVNTEEIAKIDNTDESNKKHTVVNLIKDVSILTTIPEKTLNKLFRKLIFCMAEAIEEDMLNDQNVTAMDIGIGKLLIKHESTADIKYKFIPNEITSKVVEQTVRNKKNLLEDLLNDSLMKKFTEVYKDLC